MSNLVEIGQLFQKSLGTIDGLDGLARNIEASIPGMISPLLYVLLYQGK